MASCPSASGSLHAQPGRGFQVLEVYGRGWGLRRPWRNREPRSPRESRAHSRYLKPSCESPPFFSATSLAAHLFYHSDKKRESRVAAMRKASQLTWLLLLFASLQIDVPRSLPGLVAGRCPECCPQGRERGHRPRAHQD